MSTNPNTRPPSAKRRQRILQGVRGLAIDFTPLRGSRDFRLLFGGQAVNLIGGQIRIVTVPYMVFLITHSSLMVGVLSLAQFVPSVLFALAGGTMADVMDRRRVLLVTQALLAVTTALLAVPALHGMPPLWYIFAIVTIAAGIQAIDAPTRRAAIPRLVPREQIANALAINQITMQLGSVAGPTIAGLLLARFGIGPPLLVNTATFAISLATLMLMAPMAPVLQGDGPAKTGFAAVVEGLTFLKDKPVILSTFLIDIDATFFGGPKALFPALATQVFKTGPTGLGLLYAAPGAGAFLGALMTGWVGKVRRQGRAVIIAVCCYGAAVTLFGLMPPRLFWLGLVFLAAMGASDVFSAVFRSTILQLAVPDRLRGRLSAVHFVMVGTGPRLGDLESGSMAALTTTQFSVVSGGVAAVLGAIAIAFAIPAFTRYDASSDPE